MVVSPYKIEKHYQENIDQFKVGDQIKLRMIFIKRGEPVRCQRRSPGPTRRRVDEPICRPDPNCGSSPQQSRLTTNESVANDRNPVPSHDSASTNAVTIVDSNRWRRRQRRDECGGDDRCMRQRPAVDLQRKLAEEILAKLDGGDSFESMARVYSEGKEAKEGGDWGWIGRDILRKELNEIAFSLKPGQHSRVIETAEGYYILEVDDVKPAHTTPAGRGSRRYREDPVCNSNAPRCRRNGSRTFAPRRISGSSKQMPNRPRIGITLGDPAGIGPEVVAKALKSGRLDRRFDYEIIGNPRTKRRADAVDWVVEGAKRCLDGELAALATAPITKELLHRAGYPFVGQTELLAHLSRTKRFAMMLAGGPAARGARDHPRALAQRRETHHGAQDR